MYDSTERRMSTTWRETLRQRLGWPTDDIRLREIEALVEQLLRGNVDEDTANGTLHRNVSSQISFANAHVDGNISIRDVAGRDIVTITIEYQEAPKLPEIPPFIALPTRPTQPIYGREDLLDTLRERLCQQRSAQIGIHGFPGMGKSRLALELAYDPAIEKHFTGGVLLLSLGEHGERRPLAPDSSRP